MTEPAPAAPTSRLTSVDLIRGAVMVLMAIDHVRVYSGIPAGGPDPAVFFTRWVTHFCAPAFIFLAGTSAFLYGRRHDDLPRFLVTRGVWLIVLELTVLRFAWTFTLGSSWFMAGVIWSIGWCMILLAAMVRLRPAVVGAIGVVIIAGHNLLDGVARPWAAGPLGWLWKIVYAGFYGGPMKLGESGELIVLYSVVPWIGVMAAGFGFGAIMVMEPARRNRICLRLGLAAIALFAVLRGFNLYGDPSPWSGPGPRGGLPAWLSFLATTKYPASLAFLLMTLGPTVALVPALEGLRGRAAAALSVFGRVPFFFYVLHIPLIHALALLTSRIREGAVNPWLFADHPMGNPPPPDGYAWSLPELYLVWAAAIAILFVACRWWVGLKSRRSDWWLRYL